MKPAAVYARVSTEDQTTNTSLNGQLEDCRRLAESRGYTVVNEVQEEFSGARLDRPALRKIREMANRGEIAVLIVFDVDRLSRSLAHTMILMDEFSRRGVELLFVNAPKDNTPEGNMLFHMRALFAEYEREKIKERMRIGRERSARRGQVLSSKACAYGYDYIGGPGKGTYVINEVEAQVVRQMFHWLVDDRLSLGAIVLKLQSMGIPTKRGVGWSRSTIRGIFRNESYTGTFYWNQRLSVVPKNGREGRRIEKSSQIRKDRSEWIAVPVPVIVSSELFDAAAVQLGLNRERSKRNSKTPYLLRNFVICGLCGRHYYGLTNNKTGGRKYRCQGRGGDKWMSAETKCSARTYSADWLEEKVWEKLAEYISDPQRVAKGIQGKNAALNSERERDEKELESITHTVLNTEQEESRLVTAYQHGIIDLSSLQKRTADIKKRSQALTEERDKVVQRIEQRSKVVADLERVEEISERARFGLQYVTDERKRDILEVLETTIHIYADRIEIGGLLTEKLTILLGKQSTDGNESAIVYAKVAAHAGPFFS